LVIQLAEPPSTLRVPWQKTPARRRREILLPEGIRPEQARPIRAETRARLVAAIVRGRRWLDWEWVLPFAGRSSTATMVGFGCLVVLPEALFFSLNYPPAAPSISAKRGQ
jgi:hypothetical protein